MNIDITKMTSKGQVVIPLDIRKEKKLKLGEKFIVYDTDDSIILKRVEGLEKAKNIDNFENFFSQMHKKAKEIGITKQVVAEEIAAYRKEKNDKSNSRH